MLEFNIMTEINIEKINVQKDEAINPSRAPGVSQWMLFALLITDLQRVVKEKIEFIALDMTSEVSDRSIEILQEQTEEHREAHRQLDKIKKHRETPRIRRDIKKV